VLIYRTRRTSETVEFVKNNHPASLAGSPGDTWRKYLKNHSGAGETFYDLEQGYLRALGFSYWDTFLNYLGYVYGSIRERVRQWTGSSPAATSRYLAEDGSVFMLEDGTGYYAQE